jgi:hypothetical protein
LNTSRLDLVVTFRQVPATMYGGLPGWTVRRSGWPAGGAEEASERVDCFEQQGFDAGLLVCCAAGAEVGDGAAVLGLTGELAQAGGDGRVRGVGARDASRG